MENYQEIVKSLIPLLVEYGLQIVGAIVILIVGRMMAKWMKRYVIKLCQKSDKIDTTVQPVLANLAYVVVILVTIMAVLNQFGIETTSLVALLGAAGLAVGLALQGTLSNIASGVMILVLRPFEAGQVIKLAGEVYICDELGLFISKFHTPENVPVYLPNSKIWGNEIHNFSRAETRRINLEIGIGYDDDMDKALEVISDEVKKDARVLADPAPLFAVGSLGDSSVNLLVRPWTKGSDWWDTRLALTKAIKQRLDKEGISIPFPQRDVHLFQDNKSKAPIR